MKRLIPLCFVLIMSGCASTSSQINYYVLENASSSHPRPSTNTNRPTVLLEKVQLANYLQSTNLPILKQDYSVKYARQSAWAEPIEQGIKRALVDDITANSSYQLTLNSMPNSHLSDYQLHIQIDHFSATDNANVILIGQYWLSQKDTLLSQQHFNLKHALTKDGFSESVEQQRQLLSQLSQLIAQDAALTHDQ